MIMLMDSDVDAIDVFLEQIESSLSYPLTPERATELRKRIEAARHGYSEESTVNTA